MNKMKLACLASLALAGGLDAWSTINWYKGRGSRVRKVAKDQEYDEDIAEQLA